MKFFNIKIFFYYSISLLLLASSCRTAQLTTTAADASINNIVQIVDEVHKNQIHYDFASLKAKVDVKGKKSKHFTVHLRLAKDSILWASITGPMGLEGARVLATNDSIFILDKTSKSYYIKPFSYIESYVPFPLNLHFMQNLILGNHHIDTLKTNNLKITSKYNLEEENEHIKTSYQIALATYHILQTLLKEKQSGRTLLIKYQDYQPQPGKQDEIGFFSFLRTIIFETEEKTQIQIKFTKLSFNEEQSFPFHIPDKYDFKE